MNITVYLGANPGNRPEYAWYAYELGRWIAWSMGAAVPVLWETWLTGPWNRAAG